MKLDIEWTGLRLKSGGTVEADLVVDATGRNSPTPRWLADIGAETPVESGEDSGFVYYNRYFRSDDGSTPPMAAPILSGLGSFSILTIPADNGTWSVTLYGLADDKPLRRFRDPEIHDRVVRSLPLHAHWLEGEPISEMASMAGVVDRERSYVVDGVPCATGIATVGDAHACTNPSLGRGMSLGLKHLEILRGCVAEHLDDPTAFAHALHDRTRCELQPYHDATTQTDRRRVNDMRLYRDGATPEPTPEERVADAIVANASSDPVMARAFADIMGCNALAEDVLARPGVFDRAVELAHGPAPMAAPGPDRGELLELVG